MDQKLYNKYFFIKKQYLIYIYSCFRAQAADITHIDQQRDQRTSPNSLKKIIKIDRRRVAARGFLAENTEGRSKKSNARRPFRTVRPLRAERAFLRETPPAVATHRDRDIHIAQQANRGAF
jgi:hypothetical protein